MRVPEPSQDNVPTYHLHDLGEGRDGETSRVTRFFGDDAAMTYAMGARFPQGCDVWQGQRFVGRVHGPAARPSARDGAGEPAVEAPQSRASDE